MEVVSMFGKFIAFSVWGIWMWLIILTGYYDNR